jgi:isopentenyl-diphosphate delta-isomerase
MVEYFYAVDKNDNVLGKATREECHKNNIIHRSVYIFVLNDRDELFLQKRSESKDLYGGYYTGSATGHVDFGEGYEEAAQRELGEELGIKAKLRYLCRVKSFSGIEREISALYLCRHSGQIRFNNTEIDEGTFMSVEEIRRELETGEKKFAYGFKVAFDELLKHLPSTQSRKTKLRKSQS